MTPTTIALGLDNANESLFEDLLVKMQVSQRMPKMCRPW